MCTCSLCVFDYLTISWFLSFCQTRFNESKVPWLSDFFFLTFFSLGLPDPLNLWQRGLWVSKTHWLPDYWLPDNMIPWPIASATPWLPEYLNRYLFPWHRDTLIPWLDKGLLLTVNNFLFMYSQKRVGQASLKKYFQYIIITFWLELWYSVEKYSCQNMEN